MGIPDWFRWIFLGLAVMQLFGLASVIGRLRERDSAVRAKARLELLEWIGLIFILGGAFLSFEASESWIWLVLAGIALQACAYAVKGVHRLRARRRPPA
ncbi:hypothetical protein OG728_39540 (plasmid) [Streptomyces microflavus]|uniref:hypothetical protein n=1 Tax=Streptomyces microflavus TaxID=1919 RepID=UPI002E0E51B0|nr:hypothetical protein OG728_38225 [Streptomyces microflavus]WSR96567.1 hypothetical protein OG728_39540 [Streptomyces microflavus]